jgi:hypothetical protein
MGIGSHTGHQGELTTECCCIHNRLFRVCYLSSTFVIFTSTLVRDVIGLNHANKTHTHTNNKNNKRRERGEFPPILCENTFNNVTKEQKRVQQEVFFVW